LKLTHYPRQDIAAGRRQESDDDDGADTAPVVLSVC
jgi:hypothetical protein